MRILLTGSNGFLGWHTRARMRARTAHQIIAVDRAAWPRLRELVGDADAVIHLAGVNRGHPQEVESGNVELAHMVAEAVRVSDRKPTVVFANSIQSGNDTPYGVGKAKAAALLGVAAKDVGSAFVNVKLPNLFGEHGRPDYNSFVASFVRSVIDEQTPKVVDRSVDLLHAQTAAQILLDAVEGTSTLDLMPTGALTSVQAVADKLRYFNDLYAVGDLPPLLTDFDVDLFNTLRSARFPAHYPIALSARSDHRGQLTEVVRSHGGAGQTFVSTTKPGITRGEHFHLRKVERFVVIGGEARIALRRLFSTEVVSFDVAGDRPVIVDMPTLWAHNITNTGASELTTLFWTHGLFDPAAPDTYAEPVEPELAGTPAPRRANGQPRSQQAGIGASTTSGGSASC